jgi:hypothetical protein
MANKKNLAISLVATAPSPATSGTTLTVTGGTGGRFPEPPFYVTLHPAGELATPASAEIVRVTAVATDTLTIVRAQRGTTAKSVAIDWVVANASYVEDTQGALNSVYVAASDAPEEFAGRANYVCDGVNDDVEIQAAIDSVSAAGGEVVLSAGNFYCANDLVIDGFLSSLPGPSENSVTIGLRGAGNRSSILNMAINQNGITLTQTPKVNIADIAIFVTGTGNGVVSLANTGSYRGFWNSSFKNIYVEGEVDNHSGWAMNLEGPFRSTFENIEALAVANGIRLAATDPAFNPGNCVFTRCFMDVGGAADGIAYELYTPDDGGSFNICTFIQCEGIDDYATSTDSIGWQLRGSGTTFFSSKNIVIIQSNMENFNTAVKLLHAEDNYIQMSWSNTKDNGTLFDVSADSSGNELYCTTSYVAPAETMTFINDANTTANRPNIVGHCTLYTDTGGSVLATVSDSTIVEQMRTHGPGTVADVLAAFATPIGPQRTQTVASSATPTPDLKIADNFTVTALAANAVVAAPLGTPYNGQRLLIRVKDNGTARTLGWNAIYRAIGVTLPTTTVISKTLYVLAVYNSADTKWDVLAVGQEA